MIISDKLDQSIREFMSQDRYGTVRCALEHLRGRVLVETGSLRERDWGGSTYIFGLAAVVVGGFLYSIDIDQKSQLIARELLRPIGKFLGFPCGDSVEILMKMRNEVSRIDLLYLDSAGVGPLNNGTTGVEAYQNHSLAEIKAAWPLLHDDSVILLDDDLKGHEWGKPLKTREFLTVNGWVCKMDEWQSVWVSGDRR